MPLWRIAMCLWIVSIWLTGCYGDASAVRDDGRADRGPEDASAVDAEQPDASPPSLRFCETWGALLMPAAEGVGLVNSSPPRVVDLPPRTYLFLDPDEVRALTYDGLNLPCNSGFGAYGCPTNTREVLITLGDQQWSRERLCRYYEDPADIVVDEAACIVGGTTVLEGELDLNPELPSPEVVLAGPTQTIVASLGLGGMYDEKFVLGTRCVVSGSHYTCPALGYRSSVKHTLIAGGLHSEVVLPVSDCEVTPVHLDIACPATPEGLFVDVPRDWRADSVSASYEGGPSYPCTPVGDPIAFDTARVPGRDFLCPPAAGHERGRGRYHIIAVSSGPPRTYEGSATDVFDGCGGSRESVELTRTSL